LLLPPGAVTDKTQQQIDPEYSQKLKCILSLQLIWDRVLIDRRLMVKTVVEATK